MVDVTMHTLSKLASDDIVSPGPLEEEKNVSLRSLLTHNSKN